MQNPAHLVFNGIDGDTGQYLLAPMTPEELSRLAVGERFDPDRLGELKWRHQRAAQASFRLTEGLDARNLAETGWGVVFPHGADPAVKEALGELLAHRREQAGPLFRDLTYRPGESKNDFLLRHGSGPGPVDPQRLPYYLLLAGDPEAVSFGFQADLDVQHAVGRICFDTPEEYAFYARSVVAAETGGAALPRRAAFFGVSNPGDWATEIGSKELMEPLAEWAGRTHAGWTVDRVLAGQATKRRLGELLGGADRPALLFTLSHGMGFANGSSRQLPHQGALLCQDWPGPQQWGQQAIPQDFYLGADDIPADASLLGLTAFFFACYGVGTPQLDDFGHAAGERRPIAPRSFAARLPQRLLAHPRGGALAVVGHVERAWGTSFHWGSVPQTAVFEAALKRLLSGYPVGAAMEYFNERYAELATYLSRDLEDARFGKKIDPLHLSDVWTAHNDARGYAIFGDPAVRLPVAAGT